MEAQDMTWIVHFWTDHTSDHGSPLALMTDPSGVVHSADEVHRCMGCNEDHRNEAEANCNVDFPYPWKKLRSWSQLAAPVGESTRAAAAVATLSAKPAARATTVVAGAEPEIDPITYGLWEVF